MRRSCSRRMPPARIRRGRKPKRGGSSLGTLLLVAVLTGTVAAAVLFPQEFRQLSEAMIGVMGGEVEFAEVFAAFGRAAGGEKSFADSLQDAYTAVFNPEVSDGENGEDADASVQGAETTEPADATLLGGQKITEVWSMPAVPENASLELRNLGFPYMTPVVGTLTSTFGWRQLEGEEGKRFHYGIDLAAEVGTEIVAFADGEVFAVGESSTLGQYIILCHEGGYRTLYAHCSEILVSAGTVSMGDTIALVGQTGSATGAHLHFELQDGTLYLNPIYYVSIW